jgi:HAE1 family hydrophobic/amphiphilic exporter-1
MISKFFIERPVLSNVIAILMILIGGVPVQPRGCNIPEMSCRQRAGHDPLSASAGRIDAVALPIPGSRSTVSRTCSTCSPIAGLTAPTR